MRRIAAWLMALILCLAPAAMAQDLQRATEAIFPVVMEKEPTAVAEDIGFYEEGSWQSAVFRFKDQDFTKWIGAVFNPEADALVTWDDLFVDGDAAAEQIEALALADRDNNAYAEYKDVAPVPRDNFALRDGQLFIYYPPTQLSYFSGRAGAYSFYAYELEGLLQADVPLAKGDTAQAKQAVDTALSSGTLPGLPEICAIGKPVKDVADAMTLMDVPDYKDEYAVWRFEAPEMRGVVLLSDKDDDRADTATITGIHAERMDFSGLQPGIATFDTCNTATGETGARGAVEGVNVAYALVPDGEFLAFENGGTRLSLHMVDGVLHSITLAGGKR